MVLILLILLPVVSASKALGRRHFGGSVIVTPRGVKSNGTFQLEVRSLQSSSRCASNSYFCIYGNCGVPLETSTSRVAWNSSGFLGCLTDIRTKVRLPHNHPMALGYPTLQEAYNGGGFWIQNIWGNRAYWNMMVHVDLGIRSDTHRSNSPPVSAMPPVVRVTRNCPRTFHLLTFDPDGDNVRCRVPTYSTTYECGLCAGTRHFSLDQDSCSLSFSINGTKGNHPIELVLEDFPHDQIKLQYSEGFFTIKHPVSAAKHKRSRPHRSRTSTGTHPLAPPAVSPPPSTPADSKIRAALNPTLNEYAITSIPPLSKVPLQFTVHVDSHEAPSCSDGDYFPVFLEPTPLNGAVISAFSGQPLEFTVKSASNFTTIRDLIVIGPAGLSKSIISKDTYKVKWEPTKRDLKSRLPICFISEARDSSNQVYQSVPRCVTTDVNQYEITVTCKQETMKVEVKKNDVIKRNEEKLHLKDSSCSLTELSNGTHLVALVGLGDCGTRVEEKEDRIIFRNVITSADPKEIISRQHEVEISFFCAYKKRTNLTLGFKNNNPFAIKQKGLGTFNFQFEFFEGPRFRKQLDGRIQPMEVSLGQMIYMQIQTTSPVPDTELFVDSCRATPDNDPNSHVNYSIIENGCVMDETVQIYDGSKSQFRFGMEAFEFVGSSEKVFITCSVLMCESGAPNTRCSQGCIKSGRHRYKREALAQNGIHLVSKGPLRLIRASDTPVPVRTQNLVMNVVLAMGCLVGCLVVVYRSMMTRATYQPLPTLDFY